MSFSFDYIWPLLALLVIVYTWFEILRIREMVIRHCQRLCREADLQLLDQTVALVSLSMTRLSTFRYALVRRYAFEVSENGVDRQAGFVIVLGSRIVESRLQSAHGSSIIHQPKTNQLH